MMDNLTLIQNSIEMLFHYQFMLLVVSLFVGFWMFRHINILISLSCNRWLSVCYSFTSATAKTFITSYMAREKNSSTNTTGFLVSFKSFLLFKEIFTSTRTTNFIDRWICRKSIFADRAFFFNHCLFYRERR